MAFGRSAHRRYVITFFHDVKRSFSYVLCADDGPSMAICLGLAILFVFPLCLPQGYLKIASLGRLTELMA